MRWALRVSGNPEHGADADRVAFKRGSDHRNKPGRAWGPPISDFAAGAAERATRRCATSPATGLALVGFRTRLNTFT
jgi:hypothetical protein